MSVFKLLCVGSDAEVFLFNPATNKPVPVCGLLGGTKEKPRTIAALGDGFCVQEDNVMAEFNIPACASRDAFKQSITMMRSYLEAYFSNEHKLKVNYVPSEVFEPIQLASPQAQTFGCDPDFNAWTLEENDIDVRNPKLRTLRTAGGHVHISFTVDNNVPELQDMILLVKALDLCLGVPSILADTDLRRKEFYGKEGAFRPKQYSKSVQGVEYRTLSNFWIKNSYCCNVLYYNIQRAFQFINNNGDLETLLDKAHPDITRAINTGHKDSALHLMDKWGISGFVENKSKKHHLVYGEDSTQSFTIGYVNS